jgi:hypothetical protein
MPERRATCTVAASIDKVNDRNVFGIRYLVWVVSNAVLARLERTETTPHHSGKIPQEKKIFCDGEASYQ